MRNSTDQFKLYGVPYSEHSSFFELTCFALSIDAVKFIATVNVGSAKSRGAMNKWFEKWEAERKKRLKEGKEKIVPFRHLDYW
jgi:DNA cross-link repair 1A protein